MLGFFRRWQPLCIMVVPVPYIPVFRPDGHPLICPFFGDQPFWGNRVYHLVAGPKPVKQNKLTVEKLAKAIDMMINTTSIQQKATQIGETLRGEDGIANAVQFIERVANGDVS